jgi:serine protease Do
MPEETDEPKTSKLNMTRHSLGVIVVVSILAGFFGGFASTAFLSSRPELAAGLSGSTAGQKVILQEDSAIIDVVDKASPAVVSVVISKDVSQLRSSSNNFFNIFGLPQQAPKNTPATPNIQQVGAGSGFFVSSDGLILTNRHVVADESATYSIVTSDGKTYDAKVLARDTLDDLALIKVEISGAPTLTLADSSSIQIGQQVLAIGNSLGQYQNTVTSGIVSGIGRSVTAGDAQGSEQLEGVIQTDAAINPGNSGGPLLNLSGQVIGINTAVDQQGQLVGFAIPANDAKKAVESFQKTGRISHPFLGVRYVMLTDQIAKTRSLSRNSGALLLSGTKNGQSAIIANSPADKAGLKEGDIITQINGHSINAANSLAGELKKYAVGDKLEIKFDRQGKEQTATATLEEAK